MECENNYYGRKRKKKAKAAKKIMTSFPAIRLKQPLRAFSKVSLGPTTDPPTTNQPTTNHFSPTHRPLAHRPTDPILTDSTYKVLFKRLEHIKSIDFTEHKHSWENVKLYNGLLSI